METSDFEVMPIGTGRQLAELSDQVQELTDALQNLMSYTGGWDRPKEHPCGYARDILNKYKF